MMKRLLTFYAIILVCVGFVGCGNSCDSLHDIPSSFVSMNGGKIHYKVSGKGDITIVFVHGFGCEMTVWDKQYQFFSKDKDYKLVFVDLPGYGLSERQEDEYTLDLFAQSIKTVLEAEKCDNQSVILVGHSLGTPVCRQFAFNYPSLTKALCDVDGVYCFYPSDSIENELYEAQVQAFANSFCGDSVRENIVQFVGSLAGKNTPQEIQDYAMDWMPSTPMDIACSTMKNLIERQYWTGQVLFIPTLVFCTQNSGLDPDNAEKMANLYSRLSYHELTTCGHFIQWEESEWFNRIFQNFLSGLN